MSAPTGQKAARRGSGARLTEAEDVAFAKLKMTRKKTTHGAGSARASCHQELDKSDHIEGVRMYSCPNGPINGPGQWSTQMSNTLGRIMTCSSVSLATAFATRFSRSLGTRWSFLIQADLLAHRDHPTTVR